MATTVAAALAGNDLFAGCDAAALAALARRAIVAGFADGQVVFQQGDTAGALHAVLEGRVRIVGYTEEGAEVSLNLIDAGGVFGEVAAIDGGPRTATAVADGPAVLAAIERAAFFAFLKSQPETSLRLLVEVCGKLRRATVLVDTLAFRPLEVRLARVLGDLAERYGRHTSGGVVIEVRVGQKELGAFIATSRESVSKQLARWRRDGLVDRVDGLLRLRDPDRLAEIAAL